MSGCFCTLKCSSIKHFLQKQSSCSTGCYVELSAPQRMFDMCYLIKSIHLHQLEQDTSRWRHANSFISLRWRDTDVGSCHCRSDCYPQDRKWLFSPFACVWGGTNRRVCGRWWWVGLHERFGWTNVLKRLRKWEQNCVLFVHKKQEDFLNLQIYLFSTSTVPLKKSEVVLPLQLI